MLVELELNVLKVTATDAATFSSNDTTTFAVSTLSVPEALRIAPSSASAGTNCLAAVPDVLAGVSASDSCSGTNGITLSQSPAAGTLVGLGTHVITVTARSEERRVGKGTRTFTVRDDTGPKVSCPGPTRASAG